MQRETTATVATSHGSLRKTMIMFAFCLAGALLNIGLNMLSNKAGLFLYLDTVFTVSVTLVGGLFWGALCGALTNLIGHTIMFWGWQGYLFALCNIAIAFVTWLFIRFFPRELSLYGSSATGNARYKSLLFRTSMERMIVLILLSFALCFTVSILGGLISGLIGIFSEHEFGKWGLSGLLTATMFSKNFPIIIAEILSRIPVNIIDRLITAFAGYGIALGLKEITKNRYQKSG